MKQIQKDHVPQPNRLTNEFEINEFDTATNADMISKHIYLTYLDGDNSKVFYHTSDTSGQCLDQSAS